MLMNSNQNRTHPPLTPSTPSLYTRFSSSRQTHPNLLKPIQIPQRKPTALTTLNGIHQTLTHPNCSWISYSHPWLQIQVSLQLTPSLTRQTFYPTPTLSWQTPPAHPPPPPSYTPNSDPAQLAPGRPATPVVVVGFNSFCSACAEATDTNKEGVGEGGRSLRHSGRVARALPFWARAAAVKAGTGAISAPARAAPTTVRAGRKARAGGLGARAEPGHCACAAAQTRLYRVRSPPTPR